MTGAFVLDVDAEGFAREVVARSHEVPVVVDFWAEWCGPCRTLGPVLEAAVLAREGRVLLAKVDVDANPSLAQQFQVRGIPAVKAFRAGAVVAEFTGVRNSIDVEQFLDQVVPSRADELAALAAATADIDPDAAIAGYEEALALDPDHKGAALGLAELLVGRDDVRAEDLAAPHRPDPRAETIVTRITLAAAGDGADLEALRAAAAADPTDDGALLGLGRVLVGTGQHAEAVEVLLAAVAVRGEHKEEARALLVDLFSVLGNDDALVRDARPRLARALY